jgi:drug/metabolite transporter (DMT)-like permease
VARAVTEDVAADPLAQTTAIMLGASLVLLANLLRLRSPLPRLRAAFGPYASSGVVTALAQATLFEALDRGRVSVVAPIVGTGLLWTVVFARSSSAAASSSAGGCSWLRCSSLRAARSSARRAEVSPHARSGS